MLSKQVGLLDKQASSASSVFLPRSSSTCCCSECAARPCDTHHDRGSVTPQ